MLSSLRAQRCHRWEHAQFLGILHAVLINLIKEVGHRKASKSVAHLKKNS